HKRGPVEEKTNYYAFGMDIPGLSSHANTGGTGYSDNRYKYNGKELQNNEFNDGSGLDWADYGARMYDPEIARWMVIDPLSEQIPEYNPYNYCIDEPTKFIDPDGRWFRVNYGYQTYDDGSFKTDKSGNKIAKFVDIKNADDLASAIENSGGNSYVKSFVDALNYITNNGADMGIVSSIIGDDQQINVSNPGGDQAWSYDNKKSQLDWNPDKGLAFQKGDEAKVSSPALLLLHEIGHAYVDIFSDKRDPNKTEDEQNRIINEAKESGETGFYFEKNAASKLGIDVRNKYTDGTRIGVTNGPLGTSPSTDPKQVLKNLDKWKEKKVKRNN
ncbi:MAG TPA: RHS repeat-associated core domain-containing protein, partial [Chitinophagaceae bacterium]